MDPLIQAGVALVTGAGSGIGQSISTCFAQRGCKKLFLVDLSLDGLNTTSALVKKLQPDADVTVHVADISDEAAVSNMIVTCVDKYGRIDFACNNAGVGSKGVKTADMTTEMFDKICNVNERGTFLCESAEIAQMLKQEPLSVFKDHRDVRGSIVNTCSIAGKVVVGTLSAYNASKHGVIGMVHVDARQFAPKKIRINCVMPGFVDTPMFRQAGHTKEFLDEAKMQAPMNRMVDPSEVAEGVIFLSGSCASAITGCSLPVDGGATLLRIL